jgi:hypothetical protein
MLGRLKELSGVAVLVQTKTLGRTKQDETRESQEEVEQ